MGKKVTILLAGVLAVFLGIIMWQDTKQQKETEDALRVCQEKTAALEKEKRNVIEEIDALERQIADENTESGTISLVFTDLDAVVFEEIWPDVQAYQMVGVLMLSDGQIPGTDGNISMEQFRQILDSGWEYCLEWSGEGDLAGWLTESKSELERNGLEWPKTIYFPTGSYQEELDEILKEYGLSDVIYHGEGLRPSVVSELEDGSVWRLMAYPFHVKGGRTYAANAVSSGESIAFTIGKRTEEEMYRRDSMAALLEELQAWRENDGLQILTVKDAGQYQQSLREQGTEGNPELEQQLEELRGQKEELEKEIQRVYEAYYPSVEE